MCVCVCVCGGRQTAASRMRRLRSLRLHENEGPISLEHSLQSSSGKDVHPPRFARLLFQIQSPSETRARAPEKSGGRDSLEQILGTRERNIPMVLALFDAALAKIKANNKAHVAFCVSGIIGCLVCYGVLQVRANPRSDPCCC